MIGLEFYIIIILLSFCRLFYNLPASAAAPVKGVRNVYLRLLFFFLLFNVFILLYIVGLVLGEVTLF